MLQEGKTTLDQLSATYYFSKRNIFQVQTEANLELGKFNKMTLYYISPTFYQRKPDLKKCSMILVLMLWLNKVVGLSRSNKLVQHFEEEYIIGLLKSHGWDKDFTIKRTIQ
eukprot:snap_masked-scaffold_19-processed-gene-1.43-mRNA-1 protein AED:1.00 eAED:1.00 QI:0/-1/0/0/-1/1/1/0/110